MSTQYSSNYRVTLFERYAETHATALDSGGDCEEWFAAYVRENYLAHLNGLDRTSASVLEVGCGKGLALRVLASAGYQKLTGIDLSSADIRVAERNCPIATLSCADGFAFLREHPSCFDVVISKAVVEHIEKHRTLEFFELVRRSLTDQGVAIIDVPNMDWLFAGHERYMDFTHEVGFTVESLGQIARQRFSSAAVFLGRDEFRMGLCRRTIRYFARKFVELVLASCYCGFPGRSTWSRSIICVARC